MDTDVDRLTRSLELCAERCADITPMVYERLFAVDPATSRLFSLHEGAQQVARGRMLALTFELMFEVAAGDDVGVVVASMAADHMVYGVRDGAQYEAYLAAVRHSVADCLGADWTAGCAEVWDRTAAKLIDMARNGLEP